MPDHPRFSIAFLLFAMVGVGIGLAGGTWMSADLFAAILGLATLFGLLIVHLLPPRTQPGQVVWAAIVTGYITAVLTALIKSALR
jgi:hypothetical protein